MCSNNKNIKIIHMWSENERLVFRAYTLIKFFQEDASPLFSFGSFYFLFFNHLTCFFSLFSSKAFFFFSLLCSFPFISSYMNAGQWYVVVPYRGYISTRWQCTDALLPPTHILCSLLQPLQHIDRLQVVLCQTASSHRLLAPL